jgi:glycosyltransferase involved in cell wall biosynthesis
MESLKQSLPFSATRAPRVTVGVPVRNGMPFLREALDSLIGQTYTDLEIIISDNASTDETEEVSREYAARDPRIRYVRHHKNIGAAGNYIRCVELARGEYFRWAAGDDSSAPTFIERCVEVLDSMPDVVKVHPRSVLIDGSGRELSKYDDDMHVVEETAKERYFHVARRLGLANSVYGLIRIDVLRKTRQHSSFLGADLIAQAEIALYGKIWEIPEYLFYRRMHDAAHSAMSIAERHEFYTPTKAAPKVTLYQWRHLFERFASVASSPLGRLERWSISRALLRDALRSRDVLFEELLSAARSLTASSFSKLGGKPTAA